MQKYVPPAGLLLLLTGMSGVGKGTTLALLRQHFGKQLWFSVSCTTRPMREGEVHGVNYFFLDSVGEFLALKEQGFFAEAFEVHGNWYGTPREPLADAIARGCVVILDIDVQGAEEFLVSFPDACGIFLCADRPTQESRMRGRDQAVDLVRIGNAQGELAKAQVIFPSTNIVDTTLLRPEEVAARVLELIRMHEQSHSTGVS